jgi:hypothetical protein
MSATQVGAGASTGIYPAAPRGITDTHKEQFGADLLDFLNAHERKGER